MIDKYFKKYNKLYDEYKRSLKDLIEAKDNIYNLTGKDLSDIHKKGVASGLDVLIIQIEKLENDYNDYFVRLANEKKKCLEDINKLSKPIYRTIIEYVYLDHTEEIKELVIKINKYYKKNYSLSHIKHLKQDSIKKFEKIILNSTI